MEQTNAGNGNTKQSSNPSEVEKQVQRAGIPQEEQYGYAQAVKVGDTIYISGQFSGDEKGEIVAPAKTKDGKAVEFSNMEAQMKQTYVNAKKILSKYGATLENVVEEVIYVVDMESAFKVSGKVRKEAFASNQPSVASTILVTPRLAFAEQLVEIKFIAKV